MQASLTDSAFRKTISASSAKELWDILEKGSSYSDAVPLLGELIDMKALDMNLNKLVEFFRSYDSFSEMKLLMRLWVMLQTFHTCWDYGRPEMKELMRLYVTIHRFLRLCKKMRCFTSTPKETGGNRRKPTSIGSHLQFKVPFNWVNQEDEEIEMSNV
ncbi:PREDICTED: uncharacterized protein LOC104706798 isoform X2 [Camelina sativa]|uniref:Uncharacterized protein LOC104706798 isoform X2 n=1 Tax=Camelina sativa TaxID=90675 RepID=A0ABM0T5V8_CAMSA|nr:PREDICTED: uncharacterized protein LOC104706798 isoform X2 [Camelina sativa]